MGLTDAICTLAAEPALCSSLGKRCREIALARWDKTKTLVALEKMLAASRTPESAVPASVTCQPRSRDPNEIILRGEQ